MTDLLLDECGDLDIADGDFPVVTGADAVRQRWLIHIRTFLGEWFLDTTIGVPYTQEIFRKGITPQILKQVFATASLEVEGVLQVVATSVDELNTATREATVTVICAIEGGETAQFRYTGKIPPEGCPPATAIPLTIPDLHIWFDASQPAFRTYDPGVSLSLKNIVGTGSAIAGGTSIATLESINGVHAVRMAAGQHLEMIGTPGLVTVTPPVVDPEDFEGEFTIFSVSRETDLAATSSPVPLWGLIGQAESLVSIFGQQHHTTVPFTEPGDGGLGWDTVGIFGNTFNALTPPAPVSPVVNDDDPVVQIWRFGPFGGGPVQDVTLFRNGLPYAGTTSGPVSVTKFTGAGVIGDKHEVALPAISDSGFNHYMGEWGMYKRDLTNDERIALTNYLLAKWRVPEGSF